MVLEAAMVMVCSILFISMGLSGEIQRVLGISLKILNCPKCLTYWTTLIVLLAEKHPLLPSIALSFLASYSAMWLTLALDAATVKYNEIYEKITENPGTSESYSQDTAPDPGQDRVKAPADDEVSQMRIDYDSV